MKLHELIKMAKDGKEFSARISSSDAWITQIYFIEQKGSWCAEDIIADWELKKEPRVIYVNEYPEGLNPSWNFEPTRGASYKIKTVKFVEVCE